MQPPTAVFCSRIDWLRTMTSTLRTLSRPRMLAACAVTAVALVGGGVQAEALAPPAIPEHLSLGEAERIFLERGLDLLIAQYGAEGAEGDVRAAGAHPNPGLDLGVSYAPKVNSGVLYSNLGANTPQSSVWGLTFGINDNAAIEDMLSGKRSLRIEAAEKGLVA